MTRAGQIARTIRTAQQLDRDWLRRVPEDPAGRDVYTPWIPLAIPVFMEMLYEALPDVVEQAGDDPRALEIGCGPGPKLLLMRDIAGLDAYGIERVNEYASAARSLALPAETADAEHWKGYERYDLVYLNRPLRDPARETALERHLWHAMKPGAVAIVANLESPPPPPWIIILDDWEARRGVWQKPLPPPGS